MTTPILRSNTRILRPSEASTLINAIPKAHHRTQFKALLFTGLRYVEAKRLHDAPEWFDGKFIHLPKQAVHKAKRKQLERFVRLNPVGREIVRQYLETDRALPQYQVWRGNLRSWAKNASLDPVGMSPKTTRKTWESWLTFYYPAQMANVTLSQGHSTMTAIHHYINSPFTDQDKTDMKEYVEGWI